MKKIFFFLSILVFFTGCKKDGGGKLALSISYNCAASAKSAEKYSVGKSEFQTTEARYTQFGDYITSITPTTFIAKFLDMRIQNWDATGTFWNKSINIIDNNTDISTTDRLADFSNNAIVNFSPVLKNYDTKNSTDFNIYVFMLCFIYQELELPSQYDNIAALDHLDYACASTGDISLDGQLVGGTRSGRYVKVGDTPFIKDLLFTDMPHAYVFGSTDSTYIYQGDGQLCINDPLGQGGNIIRSNSFSTITIPSVPSDETITLFGTMTFNITNLIQVYTGSDNIPYTSDDVFVYAPNYWERLSINVNTNQK